MLSCLPHIQYYYSTELCLAQLIDFIATGMDKQMHTGMILGDLQKAFDTLTLDHGVLLQKKEIFWFSGICN